eukprot:scaffold436_cov336-Pavlova_lutheri.AAC.3
MNEVGIGHRDCQQGAVCKILYQNYFFFIVEWSKFEVAIACGRLHAMVGFVQCSSVSVPNPASHGIYTLAYMNHAIFALQAPTPLTLSTVAYVFQPTSASYFGLPFELLCSVSITPLRPTWFPCDCLDAVCHAGPTTNIRRGFALHVPLSLLDLASAWHRGSTALFFPAPSMGCTVFSLDPLPNRAWTFPWVSLFSANGHSSSHRVPSRRASSSPASSIPKCSRPWLGTRGGGPSKGGSGRRRARDPPDAKEAVKKALQRRVETCSTASRRSAIATPPLPERILGHGVRKREETKALGRRWRRRWFGSDDGCACRRQGSQGAGAQGEDRGASAAHQGQGSEGDRAGEGRVGSTGRAAKGRRGGGARRPPGGGRRELGTLRRARLGEEA